MGSLVIQVVKVVVVSGCVIGLLAGCSSRARTTIVSVSDEPKVPVAQLEPEPVVEEVVVREVIIPAVPAIDIPVEEPARPVIRRESGPEIFATSKTPDVPSEISSRPQATPTPTSEGEPMVPSVPPAFQPAIERPAVGIPPIAFEPEMPALPTLRHDQVSPVEEPQVEAKAAVPATPEPPAQKEPIQVAKVMPKEPEKVEITTETLKEALSDIYFDYDRFSIREDAVVLLQANAQLLTEELAEKNIVIEGHCDERGTQSYNMVLGEARANAAKTFLEDLGISADKIQVVSYGKDKPFCMDQTEECWQENRRGHFVIK
jgi:peptidoglycan-associated lipoprotein